MPEAPRNVPLDSWTCLIFPAAMTSQPRDQMKSSVHAARLLNYWAACDAIGEEESARIWHDADADQEEALVVPVPD